MGPYGKDLGFLIRGIDAGALRGEDALTTLMTIDQEQQDRRAARQAAQAEAAAAQQGVLDTLLSSATTAASEGTGLEALMAQLAPTVAQTPGVAPQLAPMIESLYYPSVNPQGQEAINAGVSRSNPMLRPEDAADVQNLVMAGETRDSILSGLESLYGPKVLGRITPEVDQLIDDAMGRRV